MNVINNPSKETWAQICQRPQLDLDFLEGSVKNILNRVKSGGDMALKDLTRLYDKVELKDITVTKEEITRAGELIDEKLKRSIRSAAENIRKFHSAQLKEEQKIDTMPGVVCWRKTTPIESVGIYAPGGSAPLFSTVLMLAVPASIAGCKNIVLCSPPNQNGGIAPAILFAAKLAGVSQVYKVGGAQAIAAMAYGTETIQKVDKIFGPGNQFVTKAKQLVNQQGVAIDLPAGPSEVLIVADETATQAFVAADLLSQAEHGEDSQVVLVVGNENLAKTINAEVVNQLETLPRKEIASKALKNARTVILSNEEDQLDFVNTYAPEHLILNVRRAKSLVDKIYNAGSIFLGDLSAEAIGDYASGTNHTLPTNGYARSFSGVSIESFVKQITIQSIDSTGIKNIAEIVELMASAESLDGHKHAVRLRRESLNDAV